MSVRCHGPSERGPSCLAHQGAGTGGATRALPDLLEAELHQENGHLARFQDRQGAHRLRDLDGLKADELRLELWIAVLEEHRNNLA